MRRNAIIVMLVSFLLTGPAQAQTGQWVLAPEFELELTQTDSETEAGVAATRRMGAVTVTVAAALALENTITNQARIDEAKDLTGLELGGGTTYDLQKCFRKTEFCYAWLDISLESALSEHRWVELSQVEGMPSVLERTERSRFESNQELTIHGGWSARHDEAAGITLQALYMWHRQFKDAAEVQYTAADGSIIVDENGEVLAGPTSGTQRTFSDPLVAPTRKNDSTLAIGASVFPAFSSYVGFSGGIYVLDSTTKLFDPWRWEIALVLLGGTPAQSKSGTSVQIGLSRQEGSDADADFFGFVSLRSDFYWDRPLRE